MAALRHPRDTDRESSSSWFIGWFLLWWLVPPFAFFASHSFCGALRVLQTGMCPSHATDIAARPCSLWIYLSVDIWAPFAMVAMVALMFVWSVPVAFVWFSMLMVQRREERRKWLKLMKWGMTGGVLCLTLALVSHGLLTSCLR